LIALIINAHLEIDVGPRQRNPTDGH
jgi:hypothetical protein